MQYLPKKQLKFQKKKKCKRREERWWWNVNLLPPTLLITSSSISTVPAVILLGSGASSITTAAFSLLGWWKELTKSEYSSRLWRASQWADWNVEDGSDSDVGWIGSLHSSVLESGSAIEAARTARAPLKALEHDFPWGVHSRTVHRHASSGWVWRSPHWAPTYSGGRGMIGRRCSRFHHSHPRWIWIRCGARVWAWIRVWICAWFRFFWIEGESGEILVLVAGGRRWKRQARGHGHRLGIRISQQREAQGRIGGWRWCRFRASV